jgi:hypothetical protein
MTTVTVNSKLLGRVQADFDQVFVFNQDYRGHGSNWLVLTHPLTCFLVSLLDGFTIETTPFKMKVEKKGGKTLSVARVQRVYAGQVIDDETFIISKEGGILSSLEGDLMTNGSPE